MDRKHCFQGGCHFSNLRHVCGDSFHALQSSGVSGMEMKIYERSLQALLSSAPRSPVLARLASLTQIGELARRLSCFQYFTPVYQLLVPYDWCFLTVDVNCVISFAHVETKKTQSERMKPSYTADFGILTLFILKLEG